MVYTREEVVAAKRVNALIDADALRGMREALGLSLTAVASFVGVSEPTASRWERGERRPRPHHAALLLKLLNPEAA
jgi:DNA-binding transcriptional regulator YiaG